MSFYDKNMQKGRLKQHKKAKREWNRKSSTESARTAEDGYGDVRKTYAGEEATQGEDGFGETFFFSLMAAWLNEGRCPGGRPSVSTNYITIEASVFLYWNDNCTRHL